MKQLQADYVERRDTLVKLLGIDLDWRLHMVSDGQRRRVQLLLALIRPFDILLLDEVTTCLDVVVRQDLLNWLVEESITRKCTILYATHIFDGMDDWPTHIHYLTRNGTTGWQGRMNDLESYNTLRKLGHPSPILKVVSTWLRTEDADIEKESGVLALEHYDPTVSGGGYNPGRMLS